jgi:RNA polymerase sigma-70 factor (ECF subfamily)
LQLPALAVELRPNVSRTAYRPGLVTETTDLEQDRLHRAYAGALFEQYSGLLQRFLRRRIDDTEEAADLVQDVYLRLVRTRDLQRIAHPKAFLFQTATNLLRDDRRGKQVRRADHSQHALHRLHATETPTPERVLEGRQRLRAFEQALAELSPRCREVFLLARYDGLTHPQIARRLGITVSGVEKHIVKAIAHFGRALPAPESGEPPVGPDRTREP